MAVKEFFIILGIIIKLVSAIEICGLEDYNACDPSNATCIIQLQHSTYMNWYKHGKPEYFINPIDNLSYDELEIPADDGFYYLNNVIVSGAVDTTLSNYRFDYDYGFFNFTYTINVEVTAESTYKEDIEGYRVTCRRPFCAKLGHIDVDVKLPLNFVHRCDGSEFIALENEETEVRNYSQHHVVFKYGKPLSKDKKMFKYGITKTVGELVARAINMSYRAMLHAVDVNIMFDFTSYKKPHKCKHSRALSHKSRT